MSYRIQYPVIKTKSIFRHNKRTFLSSNATAFMQVQSNYIQKRKLWLWSNKQRFSLTFLCLDVNIDLCEVCKSFIPPNASRCFEKNKGKVG